MPKTLSVFFFLLLSSMGLTEPCWSQEAIDARFSVSTTWLSFFNTEKESENIQMYELHLGYRLTADDQLGLKMVTWKLFEPLGIQFWDPHLKKKSEYYPGRLLEYGLGLRYERRLWKGLFAATEVVPLRQEYLDENGSRLAEGFRLYSSFHLGYTFSFFEDRFIIMPQVHCNYWPVMTQGPEGFREKETRAWSKNYMLWEPNVYVGFRF